jgi:cell division protein FtsL
MATISMTSAVRRQPIARKAAASARRHLRHAMSLVAASLLVALFCVWTRVQVIELGYEVSQLRKETTELAQRRDLLEADVAALKSPERLAQAAATLGMRLPQGDEVVVVQAPPAPPAGPQATAAR